MFGAAALAACGGETEAEGDAPGQPSDWDAELRLPEAEDTNPDPDVVELSLTARLTDLELRPGTKTQAWTYNGGIPGPLIVAKRGDRVIVHFKNELPDATTVHWHGVRLTNDMDGVPDMPKPAVKPGGSFDYDFTVPDAGLYWYHPHVDSAAQAGNGLYGALLVKDTDEPKGLGDELVIVLSDIAVDDDGTLQPPTGGGVLGALFGREGEVILINGRVRPELVARAGRRQRWRILNAAKSRYFWLDMDGEKFVRIGGDGGLLSAPVEGERLLLAAGERADVLVTPAPEEGQTRTVHWVPFDRGYGTADLRPIEDIFTIRRAPVAPEKLEPVPDTSAPIDVLDTTGAAIVNLDLTMEQVGQEIILGINGVPFPNAQPISAAVGETQIWNVRNTMAWGHPFHLHGFFFQMLGEDGAPLEPRERKDTAHIPVDGTLRFAVRYDARPGMWMFHCHILDHADLGMMGMVNVQK